MSTISPPTRRQAKSTRRTGQNAATAAVPTQAGRQRSPRRCSGCNGTHYREIGPEWTHACCVCNIAHGGYCYPWHGASSADWEAVDA